MREEGQGGGMQAGRRNVSHLGIATGEWRLCVRRDRPCVKRDRMEALQAGRTQAGAREESHASKGKEMEALCEGQGGAPKQAGCRRDGGAEPFN